MEIAFQKSRGSFSFKRFVTLKLGKIFLVLHIYIYIYEIRIIVGTSRKIYVGMTQTILEEN